MPQPTVLLIINPAAGKMKSKNAMFSIVDAFCRAEYRVTVYTTSKRGEARAVAYDRASEYDLVVCCGGDGTLNEVINGLMQSKATVSLGYIPAGSTNDFANTLGLPLQPEKAVQAIIHGKDHGIDVGLYDTSRYFAYIASFGIFTAASYSAPQSVKNVLGHFAYILEGIKELSNIQTYSLTVTTDDRRIQGEYLFGAVCNSTSVAGLVRLGDDMVDMQDGLFEVILVKPPKNAVDFSKLIVSLNTCEFDPELFDFFKAPKVSFQMAQAVSWSLDGEQADGTHEIMIENCSNAIVLRY